MKRFIKETIIYCILALIIFGISYTYAFLVTIGAIKIGDKLYIPKSYVIEQDTKNK